MKCQVFATMLLACVTSSIGLAVTSGQGTAAEAASSMQLQVQEVAYLLTEAQTGHPIQAVITTLQDTAAAAVQQEKRERKDWDKYTHAMGRIIEKLTKKIAKSEEEKESLENKLSANKAERRVLAESIKDGENEVAKLTEAGKVAAADREEALALEQTEAENSQSTIAAMKEALAALTAAEAEGVASNDQLLASTVGSLMLKPLIIEKVPEVKQNLLLSLAQEDPKDSPLDGSAPKKQVYHVKSGKVIDLIKQLIHDFEDDAHQGALDAEKAKTDYDLAKGARDEALRIAKETLSSKEQLDEEAGSVQAQLTADLGSVKSTLAADSESLKDRQASLQMKKEQYKQRNYQREREQEALAFGVKILKKVSGVRTVSSMLQLKTSKSTRVSGDRKKRKVADFFRKQALKIQSRALRVLADEVEELETDPDVAKEIDLMLEKQLIRLRKDQLSDDEKRDLCYIEVNKTEQEKGFKEDDMVELDDKLKSFAADISSLTDEIKEGEDVVADLKAQMHEDRMARQDSKNENKLTIEDAKAAQEAIRKAIRTLENFYKNAKEKAEAAALIQASFSLKRREEPDSGFMGGYSNADNGEQVVQVLEDCAANFAKQEADVEAQEAADQADFQKEEKDDKTAMASRVAEVEQKMEEKNRLTEKMNDATTQYKLTDRQKAALEKYLEQLAIDCNYTTFQARADDRTKEIVALNESRDVLKESFTEDSAEKTTAALAKAQAVSSRSAASVPPSAALSAAVEGHTKELVPDKTLTEKTQDLPEQKHKVEKQSKVIAEQKAVLEGKANVEKQPEVVPEQKAVLDEKIKVEKQPEVIAEQGAVLEKTIKVEKHSQLIPEQGAVLEEKAKVEKQPEVIAEQKAVLEVKAQVEKQPEAMPEQKAVLEERTKIEKQPEVTSEQNAVLEEKAQAEKQPEVNSEQADISEKIPETKAVVLDGYAYSRQKSVSFLSPVKPSLGFSRGMPGL
eukprot:TRINITY_DN14339_c0_g1_i1.p1 TRINITY_DN14339_c0_g1~~TRINITY_DN14339_c0_g1_i1.p1  ORF type:complete len:968 (-),score=373.88 TRINITY_DN14339_c0_g1_i1:127-3030(-)